MSLGNGGLGLHESALYFNESVLSDRNGGKNSSIRSNRSIQTMIEGGCWVVRRMRVEIRVHA